MNSYLFFIAVQLCSVAGLAIYGFNALLMTLLFGVHRGRGQSPRPYPDPWPHVTVQLPIYNERFVVQRLIDAAARLDYPRHRLTIEVLDDSTDETSALARAQAEHYRENGINITYHHRARREGFKAGALAAAFPHTTGEFVAVFDADFLPSRSYLRQVIPQFSDPQVGMVQTRWGHLNAKHSVLTRAQAMALDGHFVVEQTARSRAGLFFNFNGSAGIWRRTCILDAGGWHSDTVAEDLDLSYRAQLLGWKMCYLPDVISLSEIPADVPAFKRQQFRWAKGSVQCLLKHGWDVAVGSDCLWRRAQGLLHLGGYLAHPLMMLLLLSSLAILLHGGAGHLPWGILSLAGLGPPILYAVSQMASYADGYRRCLYFPFLLLLGMGITVNNTWAVAEALCGRNPSLFLRTPKTSAVEGHILRGGQQAYTIGSDWTSWGELACGICALVAAILALEHNPGMVPFMLLFAMGLLYTAALGLEHWWHIARQRVHPAIVVRD